MNYKMMIRIHAWLLILEVAFMVPALVISMYTGDGPAVRGFVWTMVIALGISALMFLLTRHAEHKFYAREGMVTTGMAWITLSLVGCLPFFISGRIPNYIDAFFEIVSGFTTTGASICPDVEALGKGILYWRSFSHWVGGMGILVFYLAIAPADGKNDGSTLHILRAESPGPSVNKMVPRMRDTASILYKLYIVLTVLDIIFLLIGKMPVFDAFCIAFGTAGTGGFGVKADSIASYSAYSQWVITAFMLIFGLNFNLYFLVIIKKVKAALKSEELWTFIILVAVTGKIPEKISCFTGLMLIGIGGLLFGLLNMQISLANVFLPNFLYGMGMVMSMTPVINLSCATLQKEDLTMGSSLQNLMKNLGASFGTSIATTCISRFSQMHQNMMVGYLSDLNPIFAQRVQDATINFSQYVDWATAHYMALKQMHFTLLEQSTLWAFIDTFRIFAVASFVIIPLLLLMKEEKQTNK